MNTKGLYQKYFIQKVEYGPVIGHDLLGRPIHSFKYKSTRDGDEYFVLKLEGGGTSDIHIEASRKAVLLYAEIIKPYLPELSKDIFDKYGKYADES